MKPRLLFYFICVLWTGKATSAPADSLLLELDRMVENRQQYIDIKERNLAHQKELVAVASGQRRCELLSDLFLAYNGYDTDSATHYSNVLHQQALEQGNEEQIQLANIYRARCLAINGMYEHAKEILLPMQGHLYASNKCIYYHACSSMYIWEADFTTIPEEKQQAWDHVPALRDSSIMYEKDSVLRVHEAALLIGGSYPEGGIAMLRPILKNLPIDDENIRFLANSMGSFYLALNQRDTALYYYTMSAISDLRLGVREHASLREAALILFQQGEVARAFTYMRCCIEDAERCRARLRTIEMAGDVPFILDAYQQEIKDHQRLLHFTLLLLVVGLLFAVGIMAGAFVMARRLRKAKDASDMARKEVHNKNVELKHTLADLSASNESLRQSNRIRDTYVLQYMRECSETFEKMENRHQQLLHIANHENYQKLVNAVRSATYIEENARVFYQHFDETFLSLFPHFVEKFNELLRPEEQFAPLQNNRLSTELRIFALIRLGITDSDEIARFLRHSTKTIYNYRTSVRNRAVGERSMLEQRVQQII